MAGIIVVLVVVMVALLGYAFKRGTNSTSLAATRQTKPPVPTQRLSGLVFYRTRAGYMLSARIVSTDDNGFWLRRRKHTIPFRRPEVFPRNLQLQ